MKACGARLPIDTRKRPLLGSREVAERDSVWREEREGRGARMRHSRVVGRTAALAAVVVMLLFFQIFGEGGGGFVGCSEHTLSTSDCC